MKLSVLKETHSHEKRVSATPDTVKKMIKMGIEVTVEKDAGLLSDYPDQAYIDAGATIAKDAASAAKGAEIVLKVKAPEDKELKSLAKNCLLIGTLAPLNAPESLAKYAKHGLTASSLDLMPRITRAQNMDVLSSQSNLAGYRAVIDCAHEFSRAFPLMMTAAGTVPPAKVLILGAGVAGLQAIATAKRLGAVVSAFDVRAEVKEQVMSLGATFVEVESEETGEGSGGYAKEMSEEYKQKQSQLIADTLKDSDICITTALIPGRKAPVLITKEMVKSMKPGSVILDMAVEMGGNVEGSIAGEIAQQDAVKIIGYENLAARISKDSSALYARNVLNYLTLLFNTEDKSLNLDHEDEIIRETILTQNGAIVHPKFMESSNETQ